MHGQKINRYLRGFAQLQDIIDRAIIRLHANLTIDEILHLPGTYMQQFPYPCYQKDDYGRLLKGIMPLLVVISWTLTIGLMIRTLVHEREVGLESLMRIHGMKSGVNGLGMVLRVLCDDDAVIRDAVARSEAGRNIAAQLVWCTRLDVQLLCHFDDHDGLHGFGIFSARNRCCSVRLSFST